MKLPLALAVLSLALAGALAACDDGGNRRVIQITQTDESCMPETVEIAAGEKVRFEVHNDGERDKEVEGIDGTRLEEVLVPSGRTRGVNYTAPDEPGMQKIKCYVPGGASTIITVQVN